MYYDECEKYLVLILDLEDRIEEKWQVDMDLYG